MYHRRPDVADRFAIICDRTVSGVETGAGGGEFGGSQNGSREDSVGVGGDVGGEALGDGVGEGMFLWIGQSICEVGVDVMDG